jgi:predicted flap endonuclease-1-like 5' DNA nuclease
MIDLSNPNLVWFALALVAGLALVWFLFGRAGTPRERSHKPDVLDEGVGPAQRNQALIDAAPAAKIEPVVIAPEPQPVPVPVAAPAPEAAPAPAAKPKAAPKPKAEPRPKAEPAAKAEPKPKAAPKPKAEPKPAAAPAAGPDDLSRIKGLGPKLQKLLPELCITTFAQIAALTEADLAELDTKLGAFAGRPAKDSWVEQAKFLAAGDTAGFEAQFGKV